MTAKTKQPAVREQIERNLVALENAIKEARTLAAEKPGLYGGRYVACLRGWCSQVAEFTVLDHDDPDQLTDDDDVFVQVTPSQVMPLGRARYYINDDGTVRRDYFEGF